MKVKSFSAPSRAKSSTEKIFSVDLTNVFSNNALTSQEILLKKSLESGLFSGSFDCNTCAVKRLKAIRFHTDGAGVASVYSKSTATIKTFTLSSGCNSFDLNLKDSAFKVEAYSNESGFAICRIDFIYTLDN